jgi:hypothetical protein
MNANKNQERLLQDVLSDLDQAQSKAELKSRVLGEFRRARLFRQMGRLSALAAALVALAALAYEFRVPTPAPVALARRTRISKPVAGRTEHELTSGIELLTDDQLLASFPPNTCSLAEVDGHKVLVFRDPELRKQYLH